jgi:RNA polymerase sigma-70 factor (ECF subfamily)
VTDWNPNVWNTLLRRFTAPLAIYAAQFCSEPEDVVQDAFLELFRQPEPPENVSAWLYKVVRNKSISSRRSASRRDRHEGRHAIRSPSWFEESPENRLDAREITRQISELPHDQREVLVLRMWSELTFEQIAELTEFSSSTCHRLYQTALDELRKKAGIPCPNSNP